MHNQASVKCCLLYIKLCLLPRFLIKLEFRSRHTTLYHTHTHRNVPVLKSHNAEKNQHMKWEWLIRSAQFSRLPVSLNLILSSSKFVHHTRAQDSFSTPHCASFASFFNNIIATTRVSLTMLGGTERRPRHLCRCLINLWSCCWPSASQYHTTPRTAWQARERSHQRKKEKDWLDRIKQPRDELLVKMWATKKGCKIGNESEKNTNFKRAFSNSAWLSSSNVFRSSPFPNSLLPFIREKIKLAERSKFDFCKTSYPISSGIEAHNE